MDIFTSQAAYDAAVSAGNAGALLLDVSSVTGNVTIVFGAIIGVIVLIFGIKKVYSALAKS